MGRPADNIRVTPRVAGAASSRIASSKPGLAGTEQGKIMGIIILADCRRNCRLACRHGGKGRRLGLIGDIMFGIVGALIAGWLLPRLGIFIGGDFIGDIINAFIGAVILLIILRLVKRA